MLTLTIITAIELIVLLLALGWALARIVDALQGISKSLQKIAMGVRAIESETSPLIPQVTQLNQTFEALSGGFDSVVVSLRKLA